MGIGREVADAYIDVHGDLSSFRRDLAGGEKDLEKAARENADTFSSAWADRVNKDVNGKWGSILDAMYSDKQVDWDRMFGEFNPRSLQDARDQVKDFMNQMLQTEHWGKDEEGNPVFEGMKLDIEEAAKMLSRMDEVIAGMNRRELADAHAINDEMRKRESHQRNLLELQQELEKLQDTQARVMKVRHEAELEAYRDNDTWERRRKMLADAYRMNEAFNMERMKRLMDEAIKQNEAWARSFDGITKNNAIKTLNEDFEKLSKAMTDGDIGKWGNRLEGDFQRMAQRVREVSAAMLDQNRISNADALAMVNRVDAFIQGQNAQSQAMQDALDQTNRLKKAQDDYNNSLRGMAQAFNDSDMEAKFKQLAAAIQSGDWSHMARGAKDMEELRRRTEETAFEMHRLGRMSDGDLAMVADRVRNASVEFRRAKSDADGFGTTLRGHLTRINGLFGRLNTLTKGFREHLGGFAGLNVFGDMAEKGLDFIHNLDRIAVSLGKNTLLMTTFAAVGTSAIAGAVTVISDLGAVIGGLAVALPAFAVGAGIGIGVLVAAMKDMKTVLADLKPAFAELQNQISSSFWTEAAGPIREMVKTLMPILTPNLKGTATALGGLVGKLAKAFRDIPADAINTMFERMNKSIDILGNAMPPLVRAFTTLGLVGSKYFERFTTWMVKLSEQFDAFIQKSADNGDLDKWINNMIEGFKDIGRAIDGALGIFNAINTAAERAGYGGLKTFADALQGAAAIMQSPAFQTTLTTYLAAAHDLSTKLGQAIKDLGPVFESFAPTAVAAMGKVGDAVVKIIGYVGDIFTNPTFQKGVEDFTAGLDAAIAKLEPAIKPFADSLGNALTLLGKIAVSVAEVAAAFVVVLSPVLDSMSAKLGTLIEPLKNTALNFINEMKGPLEALDKNFIGPLVDGFNNKLLPAINDFIDKFGPFATKVIEDLGPSFKVIVDNVLPNFVKLAGELLAPLGKIVELLSPTLATTLENIGTAMGNLADSIKVLKGELPITELFIFKAMDPAKIQADADAAREEIKKNMSASGNADWGQVIADIFWGQRPDVFWSRIWSLVGPQPQSGALWDENFGKHFEAMRQGVVDAWNGVWNGSADSAFTDQMVAWFPEQEEFLRGIQGWTDDVFSGKWFGEVKDNVSNKWEENWREGGDIDQFNAAVNGWLKTNIGDPFSNAMNDFGNGIPDSFKKDVEEWGLGPAIGNFFNNTVMPEIGKAFDGFWKNIEEGRWGSSEEGAKNWDGFWKEWDNFWTDDANIGADIDKAIGEWWDTNVTKPLGEALDNAWKTISDWWTSGEGGGSGGGRGDNNGQQAWQDFWGGFGSMLSDWNTSGNELNTVVNDWLNTNVWEPIGKWFDDLDWADIGNNIWSGFLKGLTGKTPEEWGKFTEGFTGWVGDILNFFGIHSPSTLMFDIANNIVEGFLNGFGDFVGKVGEKWEEIKTAVGTKFEELKAGLAEKWEEFKVGWGEFWGGLGTTIGTKWEEFKTTVSTKWEELTTNISTGWETFKTNWSTFWTDVGTNASNGWEIIKTTVGTKWDELKSGLETKWGEFKTGWDTFWADTGTNLSTAWEGFKTTVGTKAGEIKSGVDTWATDFGNGWNGFWGDTGKNLGTAWDGFVGTTKDKAGDIKTGIDGFAGDVGRNWDNFWGGVGTTLSDKWNEFTGTTDKKSGEMQGDVNDMTRLVKGDWQSMLSQMNDQINSNFQSFVNVVMNKAGEIVGWVSGMPGRIMGALGNLGGLLWQAGSNIMVGFYNGLVSMWGTITNFVGGIAGWIAANKGPLDYDAKLLVPAGQAIMGGLDKGLRSQMDPLLNTLQTITAAVTDTVTADLSKSVMYVTGKDAAQGLADGLKANRASVHTALGNLGAFTTPASQITVGGVFSGSAVGRPTADVAAAPGLTIAEGAISIVTPTKSPELVAAKVIDSFVNYSTF